MTTERTRVIDATTRPAPTRRAMGAFDTPTGVNLALHIYVADKGDYYDIADGLPQYDTHP